MTTTPARRAPARLTHDAEPDEALTLERWRALRAAGDTQHANHVADYHPVVEPPAAPSHALQLHQLRRALAHDADATRALAQLVIEFSERFAVRALLTHDLDPEEDQEA